MNYQYSIKVNLMYNAALARGVNSLNYKIEAPNDLEMFKKLCQLESYQDLSMNEIQSVVIQHAKE